MELLLHPYAQVLAWALVHFLWQGALIGLVAFWLMRLPRFGAATRYTIGVAALGAMLAAPIATAAYLASETDVTVPRHGQTTIASSSSLPAGFGAGTHASDARVSRGNSALSPDARSRTGSRATGVALILAIWCAGVILLSFRLAGSWLAVRRLVRDATRPVSPEIHTLVRRVAGRLALDRVVRVCESSAVVVPVMVGWLKPVVLLPASTISGLAPAQVEALIAHELAHVRRHDYVVNLLQAVVETLLFYHPAVWLVSSHVRTEREHCCDDLAVGVCDRLVYVTALADLAALNAVPRVALAATGRVAPRARSSNSRRRHRQSPACLGIAVGALRPAGRGHPRADLARVRARCLARGHAGASASAGRRHLLRRSATAPRSARVAQAQRRRRLRRPRRKARRRPPKPPRAVPATTSGAAAATSWRSSGPVRFASRTTTRTSSGLSRGSASR